MILAIGLILAVSKGGRAGADEEEQQFAVNPLHGLESVDDRTRAMAAERLGHRGGRAAAKPLIGALDDDAPQVQIAAMIALHRLGTSRAVGPIAAALDNGDADVRSTAVWVLRDLGHGEAVAGLIARLDDTNATTRERAAQALRHYGDERAVAPLIDALDDPDESVRYAAFGALRALGAHVDRRSRPALYALLDTERGETRLQGAWLLARQGNPGALAAISRSADPDIRVNAIRALAALDDPRVFPALVNGLKDPNGSARAVAADGLVKLGDTRAVEPLIDELVNGSGDAGFAKALGTLGDPGAVTPLLTVATERDRPDRVRAEALEAMGRIGDGRARASLLALVNDEMTSTMLRIQAVEALTTIGGNGVLDELLAVVDSSAERRLRAWTVKALVDTYAEESMIPPLLRMLDSAHAFTRAFSGIVLSELGAERAIDGLVRNLADPSPEVRLRSAIGLEALQSPRAVEGLTAALTDDDEDVQAAAAHALGAIGDPTAIEPLMEFIEDAGPVRQAALQALARLGSDAALDPLIHMLDSDDEHKRINAAKALGRSSNPHAVEPLVAVLDADTPDALMTRTTIQALVRLNDQRAVSVLVHRLAQRLKEGGSYWREPEFNLIDAVLQLAGPQRLLEEVREWQDARHREWVLGTMLDRADAFHPALLAAVQEGTARADGRGRLAVVAAIEGWSGSSRAADVSPADITTGLEGIETANIEGYTRLFSATLHAANGRSRAALTAARAAREDIPPADAAGRMLAAWRRAEAHRRLGQPGSARAVLARAAAGPLTRVSPLMSEETGIAFAAQTHRLRGQTLLALERPSAAVDALYSAEKALAVVRRKGGIGEDQAERYARAIDRVLVDALEHERERRRIDGHRG